MFENHVPYIYNSGVVDIFVSVYEQNSVRENNAGNRRDTYRELAGGRVDRQFCLFYNQVS